MLESENPIPAFLATDDYVPGAFRDLLSEADGCMQKGFLLEGPACTPRAGPTAECRKDGRRELRGPAAVARGETRHRQDAHEHPRPVRRRKRQGQRNRERGRAAPFIVTMKAVVYERTSSGPNAPTGCST